MSNFWYGPAAGYHNGDAAPGDVAVPVRPDDTYDWSGSAWIVNAIRAATAQAAAQQAASDAAALAAALADPTVQFLATNTPQVCYTQVQAMVVDLATAKDMLGRFAMVLCVVVHDLAGK